MSRYRVRQTDVTPYSPANHTGMRNFRLIGAETVGARQVEMLIGVYGSNEGLENTPNSPAGVLLPGAPEGEVALDDPIQTTGAICSLVGAVADPSAVG